MGELLECVPDERVRAWRERQKPLPPPAYIRINGPESVSTFYDNLALHGLIAQSLCGGVGTLDVLLTSPILYKGTGIIFPGRYDVERSVVPDKGKEWRLVEEGRPTPYAVRLAVQELVWIYELRKAHYDRGEYQQF